MSSFLALVGDMNYMVSHDFIFWGAITLICVVPASAHYWWMVRRAELDADLKLEMLARGMSADDIARVLKASTADSDEPKEEFTG